MRLHEAIFIAQGDRAPVAYAAFAAAIGFAIQPRPKELAHSHARLEYTLVFSLGSPDKNTLRLQGVFIWSWSKKDRTFLIAEGNRSEKCHSAFRKRTFQDRTCSTHENSG